MRVGLIFLFMVVGLVGESRGQTSVSPKREYNIRPSHPRLIIEDIATVAERCAGPLGEDYRVVKERADAAVRRGGIEFINNQWSIPEDLMNCGLTFLVERQLGHESRPYADVIIKQWGDGAIISNPQGSHFGYHALAYDWIYDALTPEQRLERSRCNVGFLRLRSAVCRTRPGR